MTIPTRSTPENPVPSRYPLPVSLSHDHLETIHRVLARAVSARCPAFMRDRADDIVQDAMIKVVRLLDEGKGSLQPSYLWRVATTVTIDEIRRHRRRREDPMEDLPSDPTDPQPTSQADSLAQRGEIARAVEDCMSRLQDNRRRALTLYLVGHKVPEAAQMLGWTSKKTENNVYRGLANLRDCLAKKGITP